MDLLWSVISVCYYLKREDEMFHYGSKRFSQRQHVCHCHAAHRVFGHHHLREGLKAINMEERVTLKSIIRENVQ